MDWTQSFFQQEEAIEMKRELEEFISCGNSVEQAFSVLQERRTARLTEDDLESAARVYMPLAALQLQYGALQEDVQETVLSLLSQGEAADYPAGAVTALEEELQKRFW
ncbi:hypothetical protein [Ectobacillus ponti]|uniref:Uncharacterized protein n=1 Tax=Ectobacillus ponti TaxID=2961894 RepID=A0AA42BMQ5_9BACI|nr:hypothetical protein [Ectobacillus ponti]MCP8967105.1 hypothetical protein [Ectobacillus ponti]